MTIPRKYFRVFLSRFFLGAVCFCLAVLLIGAIRSHWPSSPKSEEDSLAESGLFIAPEKLDFGEVYETPKFDWVLTIENNRSEDLEIDDLVTTCNCTSIEPKSLKIPGRASREIHLRLDLTAERAKIPDVQLRDFEVWIGPRWKGNPEKTRFGWWKLRGRIRSAFKFESRFVDFGRHSEASQPLAPQEAIVTTYLPLQNLSAVSASPLLKVDVVPVKERPNQFKLLIRAANLPTGTLKTEIEVIPQLSTSETLPAKSLAVTACIENDFQVSPAAAHWGARAVGEIVQETLNLYSLTEQPFEILKVDSEGEGLFLEKTLPEEANRPVFVVKQQILKPGNCEGRIVFHLQTAAKQQKELVVLISYLGIGSP